MLLSTCEIMGVEGKGLCVGGVGGGEGVFGLIWHRVMTFFLSFKRRFTSL